MRQLFFHLLIYIAAHLLILPAFAQQNYYYPPNSGTAWETLSPDSLGWCPDRIDSLYRFLDANNSKSFIVLKGGKIVLEQYFDSFTQDSFWYYASAGKSVMAFLTGMAQEEGLLDIHMPVSTYLDTGWTVCPRPKEDLITVWHQLSMSSGLDDGIPPTPQIPNPLDCLDDSCLQYLADAGSRWAYHNAPYRLLQDVLENASGMTKNQYTLRRLLQPVGMQGFWFDYVFYGKARDMARFGHLILSNGSWNGNSLLGDTAYLRAMHTPSQSLNESYGLLWWLNGQPSYMLPGLQFQFNGPLIPNAPADMFAALGKNDQKIYVIPSEDMVVIRQGNSSGISLLAVSTFDNELWKKINELGCGTTPISAEMPSASWKIYPQPAREILWVETPRPITDPKIRLIHLDGRELSQNASELSGNKIKVKINGLQAGMYILEIGGDGEYFRKKICVE